MTFFPRTAEQIRATLSESLKGVVAQNLFKRIDKKGRVAALEILVFNTAVANLVREGKTHQIPGMIQVGKKYGNTPLDDSIMDHLKMKRISPGGSLRQIARPEEIPPFPGQSAGRGRNVKPPQATFMRRSELDYILASCWAWTGKPKRSSAAAEISDLNFTVDKPAANRADGELIPVSFYPPIENLTPYQTEMIALNLINGNPRLTEDLMRNGSCDSAYSLGQPSAFSRQHFLQRGRSPSSCGN